MLDYLKDKKDVGFFLSVQALMQTCRSVMNCNEFDIFSYFLLFLDVEVQKLLLVYTLF